MDLSYSKYGVALVFNFFPHLKLRFSWLLSYCMMFQEDVNRHTHNTFIFKSPAEPRCESLTNGGSFLVSASRQRPPISTRQRLHFTALKCEKPLCLLSVLVIWHLLCCLLKLKQWNLKVKWLESMLNTNTRLKFWSQESSASPEFSFCIYKWSFFRSFLQLVHVKPSSKLPNHDWTISSSEVMNDLRGNFVLCVHHLHLSFLKFATISESYWSNKAAYFYPIKI